ncbi:Hypothetical predicted protein [Pelobates cultripes]|uniref:Uncharacterized protein n=1 Tax=Pelobates cultripes TaxID=61616 RepID=A0AAD1S4E2_PELCU|nr:Hypothetical predicted protein [Pelobates cultripes]
MWPAALTHGSSSGLWAHSDRHPTHCQATPRAIRVPKILGAHDPAIRRTEILGQRKTGKLLRPGLGELWGSNAVNCALTTCLAISYPFKHLKETEETSCLAKRLRTHCGRPVG